MDVRWPLSCPGGEHVQQDSSSLRPSKFVTDFIHKLHGALFHCTILHPCRSKDATPGHTTSNKKLLVTRASLLGARTLLDLCRITAPRSRPSTLCTCISVERCRSGSPCCHSLCVPLKTSRWALVHDEAIPAMSP